MDRAAAYAQLLLEQGRADLAEGELRRALATDPDDAELHALLALVLADLDRAAEALAEAEAAIGADPEHPLGHHARARALLAAHRPREAEAAAREALRLDPEDPAVHTLKGFALLEQREREGALRAAEDALALDPEHVGATNLRAIALVQLNRRAEAGQTLDATLARDPEDATTHANRGWTLLHEGRPREAAEAFREALRLDPNEEWAREGIVEALKARNVVYRLLLRYFLWMERLSGRARWGVILGTYFAARLFPVILPIYLPFVVLTWSGRPLFNLLLRLDPFGRLVLSDDERLGANLVGACLAAAAALAVLGVALPHPPLLFSALVAGSLIVPVGGTFSVPPRRRRLLALYTGVLAVLAAVSIAGDVLGAGSDVGATATTLYLVGWIAFSWFGNLLAR